MNILKTDTGVTLIQGTTGTFSFGVFARSGNYAIAIRSLTMMGAAKTHFGFRVRAIPLAAEGVPMLGDNDEENKAQAEAILKAFEGLNFSKVSGVRASLMGTVDCDYGKFHIPQAIEWYNSSNVATMLLDGIYKAVTNKDCFKVTEYDKVIEWLAKEHLAPLVNLNAMQNEAPADGGGVVLSFNQPADVDHDGDDDEGDDKPQAAIPTGMHLNSSGDLASEAAELKQLAGEDDDTPKAS